MAKVIYTTSPPCCPGMEAGNEAVKKEMGPNYRKLDKYSEEDGPYREIWMKAYKDYIAECGRKGYTGCPKQCGRKVSDFVQEEDPKYPEGTLKKACGSGPKPPDQKAFLKVRVLDQETKEQIPGAQVRKCSIGREETTDASGTATFDNITPGRFRLHAWKRSKSWEKKFLLYPSVDRVVTIAQGETKTVDIFLKREKQPMTLFVEVRDWKKKLLPGVRVLLGAPPKPKNGKDDLSRGPFCIYPPGVDCRRPVTDKRGEVKIPRLARQKYMVIAKEKYAYKVFHNPGAKANLLVECSRKIVNLKESKSSWEQVKLFLKEPPKKTPFRLKIVSGTWASRGVKKYIALLGVTVRIAIRHEQTREVAVYKSDAAALIKIGVATPGIPWPVDTGTIKGKGWSNVFLTDTFEDGKIVNQTSFAGKLGIKLYGSSGLGTNMDLSFYEIPYPDSWFAHLKIIELGVELSGLPDIPGVGTSTTGTGSCMLSRL